MRTAVATVAALVALSGLVAATRGQAVPAAGALPPPTFHHLHLNSINPDAAVDFYTRVFPSTSRTTFAGQPALQSPTDVLVLFTPVDAPPATQPDTAFWHFGWHVADVHASITRFRQLGVTLLPLYTGDGGGTVFTSADTWPGTGGTLGLTTAGIARAKAAGVTPTFGAGFAYLRGPDDALVEYQGNMPTERFNHIHMWMEQPVCAELWYERHLLATVRRRPDVPPPTAASCAAGRGADRTWPALDHDGMYRSPSSTGPSFSGVSLFAYKNQTDTPLAGTRGHLMDHFALGVADLDPWLAKFRAEGVRVLAPPYRLGDHRAVLIEGPSREAIELVEIAP